MKKLFVGGIPYDVTSQQLEELFAQHGKVSSSAVISDRYTGQSKGFGFVEMDNDAEAQAAMQALNGYNWNGRPIAVNEARPQEPRNDRGPRRDRNFGGQRQRSW